MKNKIFVKCKKILVILLLLIILFPYSATLAAGGATAAQVGNAIATFAKKYYDNKDNLPLVSHPNHLGGIPNNYNSTYDKARILNEDGTVKQTYIVNGKTAYILDCVGWVNYCIYNVTKLDYDSCISYADSCYFGPNPRNPSNPSCHSSNFELLPMGPLQSGDVVISSGHVSIYINNNGEEAVIESINAYGPYYTTDQSKLWGYRSGDSKSNCKIGRIKESAANTLDPSSLEVDPSLGAMAGAASVPMSEFYYNGIPNGEYSVSGKGVFAWLIEALRDIFEFLLGICAYVFRMVFVGWTALIENLITYAVETIMGNDKIGFTATFVETDDNITIEKIVFDEEEIFDVNFFDFDSDEEPSENPE